jgi:2-succinyl-6-hydroxy-2,4-cyclohexadiene-1-carboxylate synthase
MRLHAEAWGTGAPLVLLHGFTGCTATWEPARQLLGARHRVIAIDLPGHGGSPAPAPSSRLPDVADVLVAALDRVGVRRAAWLGYSLGGRAALHVALAHPSRVGRLVLESVSPGITDARERAVRTAADDARAARLEREGLAAFVERWMAQPLFTSQRRLDAAVLARERAIRLDQPAAGLAAVLRTMSPGRQVPLWERLPALAMPVLLVAGADDEGYTGIATAMARRLRDVRVAIVPEAGHAVHLENPVPFWSLVCTFLAEGRSMPLEESA